ncbi:MAG: hypothetical protein GF384_02340 [Elusimicrobia bacterium]|nr:hypothetical protein [Elusimicrobiota bacterium]
MDSHHMDVLRELNEIENTVHNESDRHYIEEFRKSIRSFNNWLREQSDSLRSGQT